MSILSASKKKEKKSSRPKPNPYIHTGAIKPKTLIHTHIHTHREEKVTVSGIRNHFNTRVKQQKNYNISNINDQLGVKTDKIDTLRKRRERSDLYINPYKT